MHFLVIKIKALKLALVLVLVTIMLSLGASNDTAASVFFGGMIREIPIYSVETEEPKISISFDATWGADKTEDILELLNKYNVTATFFLSGIWVETYPELVKKICENGCEIGTHANTHKDMTKQSKSEIITELEESTKIIKDITKKEVTLFRAPFGAYNNTLINTADELGLKTIQWDVDSLDWKGLSAIDIVKRILDRIQNGSIVLMHNDADNIVEALNILLERLKLKNYDLVAIGDLILKDDYYIDSSGQQRKN